ncbi:MAG: cupin domain-containing protein [Austwickia sp.]|jgi:mannose-6-phosphate isomerase-like protein (cupin superfamily)|nr:cupin domain-containing protein [Austwickia sp.]MBK8436205.1 cupin domain-containing protein [Austwickia sp.]MBK9101886.1 cupin domain-containing protein [Austwickia sp.]
MTDPGHVPFVVDIEAATTENATFRTALWTGSYLQMTVMSIEPGDDIGLEMHPDVDQFLRVEAGQGKVEMGPAQDDLPFVAEVEDDWAILVPAGQWHNVTNTGSQPLKVYSIYGPPNHPLGTVHADKAEAEAAEAAEHGH